MSIKRSEVSESEERLPLLSERKKYPELFRWKIASIVVTVLIAAFLAVDIVLLVKYNQNQPRKINYTFMIDILNQKGLTQIDFSKRQIVNILTAFSLSFQELWFQSAQLVSSWDSSSVLTKQVIASFFLNKNDQLLTIFQFGDATNTFQLAAYTNIKFPLPPNDWVNYLNSNTSNSYYTFQIEGKQSVLLGGNSQTFLRMSGVSSNLLNCRILDFFSVKIRYLQAIAINYNNTQPTLLISKDLIAEKTSCFNNNPPLADFNAQLQTLVGSTLYASISSLEMIIHPLKSYEETC